METTTTRPVAPVGECPAPSNLLYGNFATATLAVRTRRLQPELSPVMRLRVSVARCWDQISRVVGVIWKALIVRARRIPKSLVVQETAALGDRRFVLVVQFEQQRFLIGTSPSSVTLLAPLPDAERTLASASLDSHAGNTGPAEGADR